MSEFGKLLRTLRLRCKDPLDENRILSQSRFGELIGTELGIRGFSAAAVSDWERGKSKVHADERNVLINMIKVLHKHGGIKELVDANKLLEAGDYRILNVDEIHLIFPELPNGLPFHPMPAESGNSKWRAFLSFERIISGSDQELKVLIAKAEEGPSPSWPRVLVALVKRVSSEASTLRPGRIVIWVWLWLFTCALITPSLLWPFNNSQQALLSITLYAAATIIIPLFIGTLTKTKENQFWQQYKLATASITRLYVYQGAGIGFNIGYFLIFTISLLAYYLNIPSLLWVKVLTAIFPLILGVLAAHLVPYNLWLAYGRLSLKDGWLFFLVDLSGLLWGIYFLHSYSILLEPVWGILLIMMAISIFVLLPTIKGSVMPKLRKKE